MESKIKVLISDKISDKGIELLEKEVEVDIRTDLTPAELKQEIGQYDGIIVRSGTTLTGEIIENADKLKAIGRAGTGYDNIDISAATKKGIIVFNTPNSNTISAVEHTMGMLLSLSRNIPQANESTIRGNWERKKFKGVELYNKVLGIIGLGKIGSQVAKRAQAFDMKVIAYDEYVSQKQAQKINVELVSLEQLLERSDFITLHTPLTEETFHLLSEEEFDKMKDGVRIVNCARGGNIDSEALAQAIEKGKVAGAALDAHEDEPFDPDSYPLTDYKDKVIMTCHLGASTQEAMDRVASNAVEQLLEVLRGNLPSSPLNISNVGSGGLKNQPMLDLANRLGGFLAGFIGPKKIEKVEIEFGKDTEKGQNEVILIHILKEILDPVLEGRVNLVNALIMAEEREINIKKSYINEPSGFNQFIRVTVKAGEKEYSVGGDIEVSGPQLVEVNEYRIELGLSGKMLLLIYQDKPGVIGKVGTLLGEENINVGSMHVGRNQQGKEAIMLIKTDSAVGEKVMEKLNQVEGIGKDIKYIEIEE